MGPRAIGRNLHTHKEIHTYRTNQLCSEMCNGFDNWKFVVGMGWLDSDTIYIFFFLSFLPSFCFACHIFEFMALWAAHCLHRSNVNWFFPQIVHRSVCFLSVIWCFSLLSARSLSNPSEKCNATPARLCKTRYNTTAPMYGVSLTSGQPVTIVQKFPDLLQQVVFEVCE